MKLRPPRRDAGTERSTRPDRYPWMAMGVVFIGSFMVILDTTIVNVALPQIGIALGAREGIEWVVTAYLLAVGVTQPATGWLADRFGRKAVFTLSLGLFALGSLLAALSPNLQALVAFRILQGLGGGAVMPVGMTMIYELFPVERRGTALGTWAVAVMAAPAFGPVIGGYLVTAVSWHWLFLVNVPIGAVGVLVALRILRDTGYREHRRFDAPGLGLAATGLVAWLLAFSRANEWGWGSAPIVALLTIGAVALGAFVRRELRLEHPLLDLRIFKVPIFTLTILVSWTVILTQFGRLVFLPLELQTLRGMTAFEVGLLFTPAAVAAAAMFPLGGRLTDRIGPRPPVIVGTACMATAGWILGHLTVETPLRTIVLAMVVQGLGTGLAMMPMMVTGLNALPARFVAQAAAVRSLNRRVSASLGVAILATVVASRIGAVSAEGLAPDRIPEAQAAYNLVFLIGFVSALVGLAMAFLLPNAEQNRALHAERATEAEELELDTA